ncbi:hypothetical protein GYMLUDRAFT_50201 [Collybiopsis luxurians FD-317 M1]|uniref:Uncharacterized protein n=1 Tax=Collybiopsis luxurians FD-317 M1 TaxID=944289 RepID=A0A0D0C2D0_9AGAR|nr:hypothetical protein GYMLUDRAFT_50201 [Collybiopsis luxurians FD-317 M1]
MTGKTAGLENFNATLKKVGDDGTSIRGFSVFNNGQNGTKGAGGSGGTKGTGSGSTKNKTDVPRDNACME